MIDEERITAIENLCQQMANQLAATELALTQERAERQKAVLEAAPPGTMKMYGGGSYDAVPTGWLPCDGTPRSRAEFPQLFAAIGTAWGAGDGSTTFTLPDLQGRFPRGVDTDKGRDPGDRTANGNGEANGVGSTQEDTFASHDHPLHDPGHTHDIYWGWATSAGNSVQERSGDNPNSAPFPQTYSAVANITMDMQGGAETRPKNATVLFIIKADI